jgi:carbamoyl-phosphate synthase small subunit
LPSPAVIVLEDGVTFAGEALAGSGSVGGEIVFNTSMSGYQEIATDPSYCGQLITYTFPMNGNYGADADRDESGKAHARAIIARELTNYRFNRASRQTWLDWLAEHGVLAVTGVDTRALTRHIREQGALRAVVSTDVADIRHLRKAAQGLPAMGGLDLAKVVTCEKTYAAQTSAREVLKLAPDGVFLSNGPGDPAAVTYAVKAVERLLGKVPIFGICLGHQILGLALGGKTYKLKFGHHGANHPVMDLTTRKVEITSQNHGFAVDVDSLAGKAVLTHINLNDNTVEGMRHDRLPIFSVQYHPEASPGPNDPSYLFDRFSKLMDEAKR